MKIVFLCSLVAFSLCNLNCKSVDTKNNTIAKRYTNFGVAQLPDAWEKKSFRNADLFFQHRTMDATIYLNAQCEKFSDSPLEALTAQMLVGMGSYSITSQNRINLADREALVTDVNVNLDGVSRYLKIMVARKNRCVFDAVLSVPQPSQELAEDFNTLVQSFWAEAEL